MSSEQERFEELLPLARSLAHKYASAWHEDFGVIHTSAMMGAWKAAQTWDESYQCSLKTWGTIKITGFIIDEARTEMATWGGSRKEHCRVHFASLDEPIREGKQRHDNPMLLQDFLPDKRPEREFARVDDRDLIRHLKTRMREEDWDILKSWVCEEEPMWHIGERYGVTESRICQKMKDILRRARNIIEQMYITASDDEQYLEMEWLRSLTGNRVLGVS